MKNQLKSVAVSLCVFCLFLMTNCKNKDNVEPGLNDCGANAEKFNNALTAYGENPTEANCDKYKKELRFFLKSCSAFYVGVTKEQWEEILAEPCDY